MGDAPGLDRVRIAGYRSVRSLTLPVDRLTVFVGANGVGKTNLYRALGLLRAAAAGRLSATLAREGGMPSVLWAGARAKGPVRMELAADLGRWRYQLVLGLPGPTEAALRLDPSVKREEIRLTSRGRRTVFLERDGPQVRLRDAAGRRADHPAPLLASETALGEIRDAGAYPEAALLRAQLLGWRFYHGFRTDAEAAVRRPQLAVLTPTLSADGSDLAAVLATCETMEPGGHPLRQAVEAAFPGSRLEVLEEGGRLIPALRMPGFHRPFDARELSDGTLRYLCLMGALLAHRLPPLVALNEPEASLHPDLLEPLARLVAAAAERTQLWIVTHSEALAGHLARLAGIRPRRVVMADGATAIEGLTALGVWRDEE